LVVVVVVAFSVLLHDKVIYEWRKIEHEI